MPKKIKDKDEIAKRKRNRAENWPELHPNYSSTAPSFSAESKRKNLTRKQIDLLLAKKAARDKKKRKPQ